MSKGIKLLCWFAAIEYLLIAIGIYWISTQHHVLPKAREEVTVYDNWDYKTIIEEDTGRSWRYYHDGTIEVLTEGNDG